MVLRLLSENGMFSTEDWVAVWGDHPLWPSTKQCHGENRFSTWKNKTPILSLNVLSFTFWKHDLTAFPSSITNELGNYCDLSRLPS